MEKYKKIYLRGNAKAKKFENGGSILNISIPEAELAKVNKFDSKKGEKWLSFSIAERREEDEYGNTHYVYVSEKQDGTQSSAPAAEIKKDDFPF